MNDVIAFNAGIYMALDYLPILTRDLSFNCFTRTAEGQLDANRERFI
jgi:hypothetical protein